MIIITLFIYLFTEQFIRSSSADFNVQDVFISLSALKFSHIVLIKKECRLFPGNINHFWLGIVDV